MSYLALYRKYRPCSFDDVFGQKYIVEIIKNSIINNKIFHAYLFSGPRGTGKTTMAKIIAKTINCSNLNGVVCCDECDSCKLFNEMINPDIVEIDAASNNGVDDIRAIRDKVSLLPGVSKYKIYIIDEVHMLSSSAFNALLKTLEEPPKHVVFILATTEFHQIPETIVSRCQCYDFERISNVDIVACLKNICSMECLNVSDRVLELIADYSNGGMRDSIGLLDKLCSCSSVVDENLFYNVVGIVSLDVVHDIVFNIINGNIKELFDIVENLEKNGKNLKFLVDQIMKYLKDIIVNKNEEFDVKIVLDVLEEFNDISLNIKFSTNVLLSLQVGLLKIVNNLNFFGVEIDNKVVEVENNSTEFISDSIKESDQMFVSDEKINVLPLVDFSTTINNAFALADKKMKTNVLSKWNGFYDYVHNKEFSSVVSYFLDSELQVVGEKDVIISAKYDSVVENASRNIAKLELLFNLVMGKFYNIAFVSEKQWFDYRDKYISDINNGKKYEYIEHSLEKNDIINNEDNSLSETLVDAKEIFGNDIVELK